VALLLRKLGRVELARSFFRDIVNENDYYYFVVGKTTAWEDEEAPPSPTDSDYYINEFRREAMFLQRVNDGDVCLLARRIDWTSGTVYDSYDHHYSATSTAYSGAQTLDQANFYVMTDEYKVYKCLDNNYNSQSTFKPTSTSTSAFELSDGYIWKFMFEISAADRTKFLDPTHIPVRKISGNPTFDVNGEIDTITVTNGGSGYTSEPTVIISGDGTGAVATATFSAGAVTGVTIDSPGEGYSFAFVSFAGGGGSGAVAEVTLGDDDPSPVLQASVEAAAVMGTIDKIKILNTGVDYSTGDAYVSIEGDGSGAEATLTISEQTGAIVGITVTNAGSGYSYATVTVENGPVGIGVGASAEAVISPQGGHGSNAIRELFATTVGVNISFSDNSNADLILGNDFRQVGVVKNIYNYAGSAYYTNLTATSCFVANVSDKIPYNIDDVITNADGGKFRVSQIVDNSDGTTFDIYLVADIPIITSSSVLENTTTGVSSLSINSVTNPEVKMSTGEVTYIENRSPITRSSDQVENISLVIDF
jgi:hypothetical protein